MKRHLSGHWVHFLLPRRITIYPTRVYRWLNFYFRLKDKGDKIMENELLYNDLYERTKDFGRSQFIKSLMQREIEISQLKDQIKGFEQERSNLFKSIDYLRERLRFKSNIINKASSELQRGIAFCQNDSQGMYDKCNIAINREKKILEILNEASKKEENHE